MDNPTPDNFNDVLPKVNDAISHCFQTRPPVQAQPLRTSVLDSSDDFSSTLSSSASVMSFLNQEELTNEEKVVATSEPVICKKLLQKLKLAEQNEGRNVQFVLTRNDLPEAKQPRYSDIENQALVQAYLVVQMSHLFHGAPGPSVSPEALRTQYLKTLREFVCNSDQENLGVRYVDREGTALLRHFKALRNGNENLMPFINTKSEFGSILHSISKAFEFDSHECKRCDAINKRRVEKFAHLKEMKRKTSPNLLPNSKRK